MKECVPVRSVLITMFALLLIGSTTLGQATRTSLSGLISDQTGAAVSGAKVTAKHVTTNEEFQATTDAQGAFTFPSMPLGQFSVTVEAAGFKRLEAQGVALEVGVPAKLNVAMEVGQVAEAVVVSGAVQEVINTSNPTLTNVINTRQVRDLPLLGRNPLDLARLQAGIAVTGDNTRTASVGGLRGSATNVTQDGINAMDNFVKTDSFFAISAPSLDSTSEFSVTVGTVGSDAGRGVAQVRMVTKSGTNEFHGRLFYQHRNDALNSNNYFNNATFDASTGRSVAKPVLRQHFFGFNVGGPVWLPKKAFGPAGYDGRNKSFWFFSYEGFRENFQATRNRTVLTAQARQGLFRYNDAGGQLQTVNLLNAGTFKSLNSITGAQLNAMPASNNTLVGDGLNTAGYRYNVSGTDPNNKYVGRYDQQLLENSRIGSHKLEFVYNRAKFLLAPDTFNGLEAPFPGGVNAFQSSIRTLTTAAIHSTFGSRMTNEVRVGHQRAPVGFLRDSQPTIPFTGLNSVTTFDNTFMSQGRNTLVYQYIDNFSLTSGAHVFRMGTDIQSVTAITFNDAGINQTVNLGTNSANGTGILAAAFPNLPAGATGTAIVTRAQSVYADIVGLLGNSNKVFNVTSPTSGFVSGATRQRDFKQRSASLYFQDQWRVKRNFTFNYGTRWEFQGVPYEVNGIAIQPANGIDGLFGISGPNNLFNPGSLKGSPTTPLEFVNGDTGKKLYNNDWNNFAPFIGLAYSPNFEGGPMRWIFGPEGKSSIRAGYSISYLQDGFTVVSNALGVGTTNPGLIQTAANTVPTGVLTAGGVPLTQPSFKIPITDADNFAINSGNGLWTFDPNLRTPYVQQWSLGIEREIANNTALEVRYVGNHAIKIYRAVNFNEVNIFENGFLNEFLNAQKNLAINGGASFAPGAAGTVALPTMSLLFAGLPAASGFGSSTFITNLTNNNVGAMAFTLANSATYRGNRANLTFNGQPAPNFFLANPNANFIQALTNNSFSNYHSLQVELRKRLSNGLQLQANYTFSKTLTDTDGNVQSTLESFHTLRDLSIDKHRASFDQTHRFITNFIYELPFGPGRRWLSGGFAPLRKVVEGWQVGGIVNVQTGSPIFITSGRSTFNQFTATIGSQFVGSNFNQFRDGSGVFKTADGVFFIDPNMLNITRNAAGQFTGATLKPGLLAAPAPGAFGNFPRNSINSPGFWQTDFSLTKRMRFYEKADVEFKANFINAFNHANFVFNSQNFDAANFSRINSTRGGDWGRQINFILGINF
ncbi:MAG TPA: carboxypeptidase-like regulatory domain-containing protein [Blastocatellia bacterium]|nr:carboxypeptidase-like regulatory domain-containing protein [Blastocatellia bacterium]